MNKYMALVKNTLTFAAGTFGSKLIVLLLTPFYTRMLTPDQYGIVDILVNTANLALPIITLSIADAVVRYALDHSTNKKDVFSSGLLTVLFGFLAFLLFIPVMMRIRIVSDYLALIYFYVFAASLNSVCGQLVRSSISPRLFAWGGFQNTLMVVILNLIFLLGFKMGITGYVLSIAIADLLTAVFYFLKARLLQYVDFKHLNKNVWRGMVLFALPLIPNSIGWWITSVSDRYIITYMLGEYENGLYAAAYKIPTFVTLISAIFTQAWQLSAITEFNAEGQTVFYRRVFSMFETVVFLAASFIIVFCRPANQLLVAQSYHASWIYIPYLILAFVFQCFSGFWASIYMAAKKNLSIMLTTLLGALVNIILTLIFIKIFGVIGAAFATFLSYLVVFICRAADSRRFIRIRINLRKLAVNFSIVLIQCLIMICQPRFTMGYELFLLALILFLNFFVLRKTAKSFLSHFRQKKSA